MTRAIAMLLVVAACQAGPREVHDVEGSGQASEAETGGGSERPDASSSDDGSGPATSTPGTSDDGSSLKLDVGGPTGPNEFCECVAADDRIYLLTATDPTDALGHPAELWQFFPKTGAFELVGVPAHACGPFLAFSMSIDPLGRAWILGIGGSPIMVRLDLDDPASCERIEYDPSQSFGLGGMGFAAEGPDDACARLYLHTDPTNGPWGSKLGVLDPATENTQLVGQTSHTRIEMTGTGDGRLYGFELTNPPRVVEFDKATAADLSSLELPFEVAPGGAFAFAFFEGDFYVFTSDATPGAPSRVHRIDYDSSDGPDQAVTIAVEAAPIQVVGAGVSTCVSVTPTPEG